MERADRSLNNPGWTVISAIGFVPALGIPEPFLSSFQRLYYQPSTCYTLAVFLTLYDKKIIMAEQVNWNRLMLVSMSAVLEVD